jgi:hypothetical protein
MKCKHRVLIAVVSLVIVTLAVFTVSGQDDYSNSAALLDLGHGARPMGMGGAFLGLADDENAVFYNPAALAFLDDFGVTTLWSPQFGLVDYGGVGLAGKYVGLSTSILYSGPIDVPNEYGADSGTSFSYTSGSGVVGVGLPVFSQLSFGGKIKYYYSHLSLDSSSDGYGWSVEPAILAKGGNFGLGIMVENALTGGIVYGSDHSEDLDRKLRAGVAFSSMVDGGLKLNLVADLEVPVDSIGSSEYENVIPHLGVELWLSNIGVRTGYDGRAFTIGSSIKLQSLRLDWALSAYQSGLTETHRVSLVYRF